MLTLFTVPKPFIGPIATIQRNAIRSWLRLTPTPEVILMGNDEGTSEVCEQLGLRHVSNVATNEFGTPLVDSVFRLAQAAASFSTLAYVNSDIILLDDFRAALEAMPFERYLMVGRRWDYDLDAPLTFKPGWDRLVWQRARNQGRQHGPTGIDYFVFQKGFWGQIPPFALGRTVWDHWFVFRARSLRAPVVDASPAVMAIHQNHGYAHHPKGKAGVWGGSEAQRNTALARGGLDMLTLDHATHLLTASGVRRAIGIRHWWPCIEALPAAYPGTLRPIHFLRSRLLRWRHSRDGTAIAP